jgi:signal peptidase
MVDPSSPALSGYVGTRRRTPYFGTRRLAPARAVPLPIKALRGGVPFLARAVGLGVLLLGGLLCTVAEGPRLVGWHATTVMSNSMAPALRAGDIVLTAPVSAGAVEVGDVVRFADPNRPQRHILHRVVAVGPDAKLSTAGDANPTVDSTAVSSTDVDGMARLRLPVLGLPVIWVRNAPAVAGGLAAVLVVALVLLRRGRRPGRGRGGLRRMMAPAVAGIAGVCLTLTLGWQTSTAAFVATTANTGNSFAAGTVTMSDDDGGNSPTTGTAMFAVNGLGAADPVASRCITVIYTGDLPAPVKLYATNLTGTGLGTYLNFTVDIGTGGSYASCAGFSLGSTLYSGTLGGYAGSYTSYAAGVASSWTPTTNGAAKVFRITYSLQNNPAAVGLACGVKLVWEAQG